MTVRLGAKIEKPAYIELVGLVGGLVNWVWVGSGKDGAGRGRASEGKRASKQQRDG